MKNAGFPLHRRLPLYFPPQHFPSSTNQTTHFSKLPQHPEGSGEHRCLKQVLISSYYLGYDSLHFRNLP
jgi:hypothetical protein